jgi:hypothetical protein
MRKTAAILFTVVLAMFVTALRLPAASCILSQARSHEACKSNCCANVTCCAVSKENTGPASQPLLQSDAAKQYPLGFVAIAPIGSGFQLPRVEQISFASQPVRAHSPPPLAATCIRLI